MIFCRCDGHQVVTDIEALLKLDDRDLSYGLIVGSDVCIDGLTTLRKHCRYARSVGAASSPRADMISGKDRSRPM